MFEVGHSTDVQTLLRFAMQSQCFRPPAMRTFRLSAPGASGLFAAALRHTSPHFLWCCGCAIEPLSSSGLVVNSAIPEHAAAYTYGWHFARLP